MALKFTEFIGNFNVYQSLAEVRGQALVEVHLRKVHMQIPALCTSA